MIAMTVMKRFLAIGVVTAALAVSVLEVRAQAQGSAPQEIPPVRISFAGRFTLPDGQPRTGPVILAISLYQRQDDAAPQWVEEQAVVLDADGRYELQIGSTLPEGVPPALFGTPGATQWVGVAIQNEPEQPRVMLVSVPYAAKALAADTLGGLSASDFALTSTFRDEVRAVIEAAGSNGEVTAAGAPDYVAKFQDTSALTSSIIHDSGTGIGIGTMNLPACNGILCVSGVMNLDDGNTVAWGGAQEEWAFEEIKPPVFSN